MRLAAHALALSWMWSDAAADLDEGGRGGIHSTVYCAALAPPGRMRRQHGRKGRPDRSLPSQLLPYQAPVLKYGKDWPSHACVRLPSLFHIGQGGRTRRCTLCLLAQRVNVLPTNAGQDLPTIAGQTLPTEEGQKDPVTAQKDAKHMREAQQRDLYERTGDILYPASGEAQRCHPAPHVKCWLREEQSIEGSRLLNLCVLKFQCVAQKTQRRMCRMAEQRPL
jgi:hypothetical protein